jgi:hypothetical protein
VAELMGWLGRAFARHPRLFGWLCVAFGLIIAYSVADRHYTRLNRTWKDYSVRGIERVSIPRRTGVERTYRLLLEGEGRIGIDPMYSSLFDEVRLQKQAKPTAVEVFSDHRESHGVIWAVGLRLKSGEILLNPEAAAKASSDDDVAGAVLAGVFVLCGIGLQFYRGKNHESPAALT